MPEVFNAQPTNLTTIDMGLRIPLDRRPDPMYTSDHHIDRKASASNGKKDDNVLLKFCRMMIL